MYIIRMMDGWGENTNILEVWGLFEAAELRVSELTAAQDGREHPWEYDIIYREVDTVNKNPFKDM